MTETSATEGGVLMHEDLFSAARRALGLSCESAGKTFGITRVIYSQREVEPEDFRLSELRAPYNPPSETAKPILFDAVGFLFAVIVTWPPSPSEGKTVSQLADEAITDKWGNGADRKARLEAVGCDYSAARAESFVHPAPAKARPRPFTKRARPG